MRLVERLGLHKTWRDSHGELNDAPNEAVTALKRAEEALTEARGVCLGEMDEDDPVMRKIDEALLLIRG